jgi:hypothetical protein
VLEEGQEAVIEEVEVGFVAGRFDDASDIGNGGAFLYPVSLNLRQPICDLQYHPLQPMAALE